MFQEIGSKGNFVKFYPPHKFCCRNIDFKLFNFRKLHFCMGFIVAKCKNNFLCQSIVNNFNPISKRFKVTPLFLSQKLQCTKKLKDKPIST